VTWASKAVDYDAPDLAARVRALAPGGVDVAFDHLGLASCRLSFGLLAPGGRLVSSRVAGLRHPDTAGPITLVAVFLQLIARLTLWNLAPDARRASFYDFWAGHLMGLTAFRRRFHDDLTAVLVLRGQGPSPRTSPRAFH
jgi:NADPH:quinone reductase-like Zn-dependent oxidoreductase